MCKWTSDGQRFLLEYFDTIHGSPSHIYHSALPFCPSSSWLHKSYSAELSQEVKVIKGLPTGWGKCSRTVSMDSRILDLSCWNNTIAVGSGHGDINILDAITGSQTTLLNGHTGEINSLTFSSDGKLLVSGSDDATIKLWDVQTGGVIKTFYGHTDWFLSVSISADCTRIASGSDENKIHLWDIQTEECYCTIEQQDRVDYVSFSPTDPQYLIFISNGKVWKWNANGEKISPICNGSHIAFSPDHTQFALCNGNVVTIHNSREIVAEFKMPNDTKCCCFSPDSRFVAAAAGNIAYIWDITNSDHHPTETFIGHTSSITSLAFFSPSSLISASYDRSIKFWQIGAPDPAMIDPESIPPALAAIKSIILQEKDGVTITSDSDGVLRTWDLSTGLCKASFQTLARDLDKADVKLVNGRLIFIWYADETINIWDVEKGEFLMAVNGSDDLEDLKISEDGSRFFCLDTRSIQAWSVQTGEVISRVEIEYVSSAGSLTVDGSRVWACYSSSEYWGWDFGTPGSSPVKLSNMPKLHFNGTLLWDANKSRIMDAVTGNVVFQLPKRFGKLNHVQWNGHYLVACFDSTEVLILDFRCILF